MPRRKRVMTNGNDSAEYRWRWWLLALSAVVSALQAIPTTRLAAQVPESPAGLKLESLIGRKNLREVNEQYALALERDEAANVVSIRVSPKYFFRSTHPEWSQPDEPVTMPSREFDDLLRRIGDTYPFGPLIRAGTIGLVLNLRTEFSDEYRDAYVSRALYRDSPDQPYRVAWFSIWYFHFVVGRVESKGMSRSGPAAIIDGHSYLLPSASYASVLVGVRAKVKAAGPLDIGF